MTPPMLLVASVVSQLVDKFDLCIISCLFWLLMWQPRLSAHCDLRLFIVTCCSVLTLPALLSINSALVYKMIGHVCFCL